MTIEAYPVEAIPDSATQLIGQLVPLLTHSGPTQGKLREVARSLSLRQAYETVDFMVLEGDSLETVRHHQFGRLMGPELEAWEGSVQTRDALSAFAAFERVREPVIYNRVQIDPRLTSNERRMAQVSGLGSVLVVPLIWGEELRGALAVTSKDEGAFGIRDADFLVAVATQVSALLRQQKLIDDLAQANVRIARLHDDTVMILASTAEAHDPCTGAHLLNMRGVTRLLAIELGYQPLDARALAQAAVLHDIGKVRISPQTLNKRGPLTPRQLKTVRNHPLWGEELLAGRPGFEQAARIARWHHERWDGEGYPDRLRGEQIPLDVAIVSLADSYDAMMRARPYKACRSQTWTLHEIQSCAGKQFNPRVVEAIVRLHEQGALDQGALETE